MKVYYRDESVWIISKTDKSLLGVSWDIDPPSKQLFMPGGKRKSKYDQYRDSHSVHCVYMRDTPSTFKPMKERNPGIGSLFYLLLKQHNINLLFDYSTDKYEFKTERDQFLFDLRFGPYA